MGRQLAARHQGAAPELRVPVDEVHLGAEAAGPAGELRSARRRRTRSRARSWIKLLKGGCAAEHADQPDAYFNIDQVLEDAARAVRQRQERLRAVPAVGQRLDRDHRLIGPYTSDVDAAAAPGSRRRSGADRGSGPSLTISPPLAWFLVIYLASLVAMLITAFWSVNPFTNNLAAPADARELPQTLHRDVPAHHLAHDRARGARHDHRRDPRVPVRVLHGAGRDAAACASLLFMAVLLPLWASYLARIYAWIVILTKGGTLDWTFQHLGLPAAEHRLHEHRDVARVLVHLAAVHDHPGVHGARADPRLAHRGVGRSRRAQFCTPCATSCSRSRCPGSSPARSSRSR